LSKDTVYNFNSKPYPKMEKEAPVLQRTFLKKDGVLVDKEKEVYMDYENGIF
jgi:hypothetical protein